MGTGRAGMAPITTPARLRNAVSPVFWAEIRVLYRPLRLVAEITVFSRSERSVSASGPAAVRPVPQPFLISPIKNHRKGPRAAAKARGPSDRDHVSGQAVVAFCGKNFFTGASSTAPRTGRSRQPMSPRPGPDPQTLPRLPQDRLPEAHPSNRANPAVWASTACSSRWTPATSEPPQQKG